MTSMIKQSNVFGETILITWSANIGVGGGAFITDKEFGFPASCGSGFSLSIGFGGNEDGK